MAASLRCSVFSEVTNGLNQSAPGMKHRIARRTFFPELKQHDMWFDFCQSTVPPDNSGRKVIFLGALHSHRHRSDVCAGRDLLDGVEPVSEAHGMAPSDRSVHERSTTGTFMADLWPVVSQRMGSMAAEIRNRNCFHLALSRPSSRAPNHTRSPANPAGQSRRLSHRATTPIRVHTAC